MVLGHLEASQISYQEPPKKVPEPSATFRILLVLLAPSGVIRTDPVPSSSFRRNLPEPSTFLMAVSPQPQLQYMHAAYHWNPLDVLYHMTSHVIPSCVLTEPAHILNTPTQAAHHLTQHQDQHACLAENISTTRAAHPGPRVKHTCAHSSASSSAQPRFSSAHPALPQAHQESNSTGNHMPSCLSTKVCNTGRRLHGDSATHQAQTPTWPSSTNE